MIEEAIQNHLEIIQKEHAEQLACLDKIQEEFQAIIQCGWKKYLVEVCVNTKHTTYVSCKKSGSLHHYLSFGYWVTSDQRLMWYLDMYFKGEHINKRFDRLSRECVDQINQAIECMEEKE